MAVSWRGRPLAACCAPATLGQMYHLTNPHRTRRGRRHPFMPIQRLPYPAIRPCNRATFIVFLCLTDCVLRSRCERSLSAHTRSAIPLLCVSNSDRFFGMLGCCMSKTSTAAKSDPEPTSQPWVSCLEPGWVDQVRFGFLGGKQGLGRERVFGEAEDPVFWLNWGLAHSGSCLRYPSFAACVVLRFT